MAFSEELFNLDNPIEHSVYICSETSILTIVFSLGPSMKRPKSYDEDDDKDDSMLCKRVVTKDRRYITQIMCYEKNKNSLTPDSDRSSNRQAMRMPLFGKSGGGVLSNLFSKIGRQGRILGHFWVLLKSLALYKLFGNEL